MIPSPASLPSRDRFQALIRFLQSGMVVAVVLAAGGLLFDAAGWAMVIVLVAAPLVRVGWLAARWWSRGDRRYGLVSVAVLAVVLVAGLVALGT